MTETNVHKKIALLVRWMGWPVEPAPDGNTLWVEIEGTGFFLHLNAYNAPCPKWNPWEDANAAEQLMERARFLGWGVMVYDWTSAGGTWFARVSARTEQIAYGATPKEAATNAIFRMVESGA